MNKTVKTFFSYAKKSDYQKCKQYVTTWGQYDFNAIMDTYQPIFKNCNKKVTYKIQSTTVKGSTATVRVKVRYLDSSPVIGKVILVLAIKYITGEVSDSTPDSEINQIIKQLVNVSVKNTNMKYITKTITVKLKYRNNAWKINTVDKKLANAISGNFVNAVQ